LYVIHKKLKKLPQKHSTKQRQWPSRTAKASSRVAEEAEKMYTSRIKRMEAKGLNSDVSDKEFIEWWKFQLLDESGLLKDNFC
jgi:hypothetical protein